MSGLIPKSFKSRLTEFSFSSNRDEIIPIATTDIEDDPIILLRLKVTQPSGISPVLLMSYIAIQDEGKRILGTQSIRTSWSVSFDDGATWNQVVRVLSTTTNFQRRQVSNGAFSFSQDITDISLNIFNSDGSTTGEVKNINAFISILIPVGYTITQVI